MGLFDSILKSAGNAIKNETAKPAPSGTPAVAKGGHHQERIVFSALPKNLAELQALPEASLDTPYKTAALTIAVLCAYENDPDTCIGMLDFLKGPADVSNYEKGFIRERLAESTTRRSPSSRVPPPKTATSLPCPMPSP